MTQTMEAPANGKARQSSNVPALAPPRLMYHPAVEERFGIDRASWKALVEAIFPNASSTESVILALSYCRARKLDPFKRNVHIVPIWDKNRRCLVDTIWPGIGELRTTAFRTGEYAGKEDAVFGPNVTQKVGNQEITFPLWCKMTVHRMVKGVKCAFAGPKVWWLETYATVKRDDDTPNEMWATRVNGQIEKCAEAAALRTAFPEEIGGDYIAEEAPSTLMGSAATVNEAPRRNVSTRTAALQEMLDGPADAGNAEAVDTHTGEIVEQADAPDLTNHPNPIEGEPPEEEKAGDGQIDELAEAFNEGVAAWMEKLTAAAQAHKKSVTPKIIRKALAAKWGADYDAEMDLERFRAVHAALTAGKLNIVSGQIEGL